MAISSAMEQFHEPRNVCAVRLADGYGPMRDPALSRTAFLEKAGEMCPQSSRRSLRLITDAGAAPEALQGSVMLLDHGFASQEPEQFVEGILAGGLGVSHLVVGRGFRFGARRRGDVHLLQRMGQTCGFSVTAVDEIEWGDVRCSSTLIRDLLLAGNIEDARALLGYAWSVEVDLPAEAMRRSGELTIEWPATLLLPEPGQYEVALRRFGETTPSLSGRLAINSRENVRLSLQGAPHFASAMQPCFIDFLARSRKQRSHPEGEDAGHVED